MRASCADRTRASEYLLWPLSVAQATRYTGDRETLPTEDGMPFSVRAIAAAVACVPPSPVTMPRGVARWGGCIDARLASAAPESGAR